MKRIGFRAAAPLIAGLLATACCVFAANLAVQAAVADLQRQNYKGAEQKLRAELKLHPADAETLSLLGVALDEQQRLPEGGVFHKRAMAAAPRSTAVLYNYANNLLATGDEKTAREILLKSLAVDPADHNANLALAQIALNRKDGREALVYLDHIKDPPDAAILRLIALDLAGQTTEATALFEKLAAATQNDKGASIALGDALAKAGQFNQAETFLTHALALDPANFQIMFTLGATASRAGHNDRARTLLEAALRQQPKNVDALYTLAMVYSATAQAEQAIRVLAEAAKIAPDRADVQKLTAINARNIMADEDAVAAWERYLKLVPGDDEARREHAFGKARLALLDEALPDLKWYVEHHPDDPIGYYELGMAESVNDPPQAIERLNRAIALKPDFVAAHGGRGVLLYLGNKPSEAVQDLEFVVKQLSADAPERGAMLDRLGQAYSELNRLPDAVVTLRKAAELSPNDAPTQLHLANALTEAGLAEAAETVLTRFRQMNPGRRAPKVSGVVDYLGMSPEVRHDLYSARLEKTVHDRPEDLVSQVLYLKLLLTDNQIPEALAHARKIVTLKPGAKTLADAGHALLAGKQYPVAREMLELAASQSAGTTFPGLNLDMAMAVFHTAGSGAAAGADGLRQLERVPEAGRDAGYFLARAQMLDATGEAAEAIAAMRQALEAAPGDPYLYWQAAVLMTKNHHADDALAVLDQAAKVLPQEAEIPVTRAIVLELSGRTDDARRLLSDAQKRWPEVAAVWVAQGMILSAHQQNGEARKAIETGVALGAHGAQTLALARGEGSVDPEQLFLSNPPRDW